MMPIRKCRLRFPGLDSVTPSHSPKEPVHALSRPDPSDRPPPTQPLPPQPPFHQLRSPPPAPAPLGPRPSGCTHCVWGSSRPGLSRKAAGEAAAAGQAEAPAAAGSPAYSCTTPSSVTRSCEPSAQSEATGTQLGLPPRRLPRVTCDLRSSLTVQQSKVRYREDGYLCSLCTALEYSSLTNSKILNSLPTSQSLFQEKFINVLKIRFNKELMGFAWLSDINFWLNFYRLMLIKKISIV